MVDVDDVDELDVEAASTVDDTAVVSTATTDAVVDTSLAETGDDEVSLLHAPRASAPSEMATGTRPRWITPEVCQSRHRDRRQRMSVSASCPPSTSSIDEPVTSTTVIDALSRLRMTSRSSPRAAPMTALMAMKWLNTTQPSA